jgi:hypothetical protein
MQERVRQCADDAEAIALPESYGALIRTYHEIELHGAKTGSGGAK